MRCLIETVLLGQIMEAPVFWPVVFGPDEPMRGLKITKGGTACGLGGLDGASLGGLHG